MAHKGKLITAQKLAEELDLSVETIWRYTRQKKIPYIKTGPRQYRYDLDVVLTAIKQSGNSVGENRPKYKLDSPFTYEDYLKLPDEPGVRYEVIDGMLVRDPSPSVRHQRVSARLLTVLREYFQRVDPEGEFLSAPLDVVLADTTVVQPDLLYIPGTRKDAFAETHLFISPELVLEILSPATSGKDRVQKMEAYRKAGVTHYWLVDPDNCILEAYVLKETSYIRVVAVCQNDFFTHPNFPGLEFKMVDIFP